MRFFAAGEKIGVNCHPPHDAHQQDKVFDQMKRPLAISLSTIFGMFSMFSISAFAQTSNVKPIQLRALQTQYEEISARYQEKCKLIDYDTDIKLDRIKQGAGLAGGIVFPMTMDMVTVIQILQKQITDGMCERAKDYADLAQAIGDILEEDRAKNR